MTGPATMASARQWLSAYENHETNTTDQVTEKFARAYLAAEADNARLREALQYIDAQTAWRDYPIDSVSCSNAIFDIKDMHETAHRALAEAPAAEPTETT